MSFKENIDNLKQQDIYSFLLFVLYRLTGVNEYSSLSELAYVLDKKNFSYGVSLYNSVCQLISKSLLTNYVKRKYHHKRIYKKIIKILSDKESTAIQINKSCIVVLTNVNMPEVFKTLYIYNKKFFVCDFYNEDYFWLSDQIKKIE